MANPDRRHAAPYHPAALALTNIESRQIIVVAGALGGEHADQPLDAGLQPLARRL
jgi:hypothetical protein